MLQRARLIGIVLAGVGLAVTLTFGGVALQSAVPSSGDFRKAQMVRARNPGNAMYDLQFFIAATRLGFLIAGTVSGGLLALNGVTLVLLDRAVQQAGRRSGR
jgi:hypothetical protein